MMKYKVKFRVTHGSGKKQKYSVNLEEGKRFALGMDKETFELRPPSIDDAECYLSIRDGALYAIDRNAKTDILLNNRKIMEASVTVGDFLQVGEFMFEFLEAPTKAAEAENPNATRFVDVAESLSPGTQVIKKADLEDKKHGWSETAIKNYEPRKQEKKKKKERARDPESVNEEPRNDQAYAPEPPESSNPGNPEEPAPEKSTQMTPSAASIPKELRDEEWSRQSTAARENLSSKSSRSKRSKDYEMEVAAHPEEIRVISDRTHIASSLGMVVIASALSSSIFSQHLGMASFWAFVFRIVTGIIFASAFAWTIDLSKRYLETRAGFKDYLRFISYCFVLGIPWSFAFGIGQITGAVVSTLFSSAILWSFIVNFRPKVINFFIFSGVMSAIVIAIISQSSKYQIVPNQSPEENIGSLKPTRTSETEETPRSPASETNSAPEQPTNAPAPQDAPQANPANPEGPQMQQNSQIIQPTQPMNNPVNAQNTQNSMNNSMSNGASQVSAPHKAKTQKKIFQSADEKNYTSPELSDGLAKEEYFTAIKFGNLSKVRELVEKKLVHPVFTMELGTSGLAIAAQHGHLEIVKYLLYKKANIDVKDPSGTTPLMWAVYRNHKDVVKYLLKKNANLDVRREDGDRALDIAQKWQRSDIIKMIEGAEYAQKLKAKARSKRKIASSKKTHRKKSNDDESD